MNQDTNSIVRAYLVGQATLTDIVSTRIFCPRLPEGTTLPALSFFTRGGVDNPHIETIEIPSIQFDCWDDDPIGAREVYRALYNVLQGIQEVNVTIGADTYRILSAIEEVKGQDLQDVDIPNYFRVLTFFKINIQAIPS
jgi:hypothetical protein